LDRWRRKPPSDGGYALAQQVKGHFLEDRIDEIEAKRHEEVK